MSKREVFHSTDDPRRLHISPPGTRTTPGDFGRWAAHLDQDNLFTQIAATARQLYEQPPVSSAAQGLDALKTMSRLRSMLDAAEAAVLADSFEHAVKSASAQGTQEPLIDSSPDPFQEQATAYYSVNPSDEAIVRSSFVAEASIAIRASEANIRDRLFIAEGLRHLCPETLEELSCGEITTRTAQEIVKQSQDLEPADVRYMQQTLLPIARTAADSAVAHRARKIHERLHPQPIEERHKKGVQDRKVIYWHEPNGMSTLQLHVPAEKALSIINTVNWHASQHDDPDDERTEQQRRLDIICDALIDGWPAAPGTPLKARVAVTIPALEMLANPKRALADLEGYGPIPIGTALRIAQDAPSFMKVLTDPWSGAVIDVGREKYRPSKALRDLLRNRDICCRFPGCNRPAETSEIDHIEAWAAGGHTSRTNTHLLCKRHQMFKHALGWQATYLADGSVNWRSPHGVICIELPGSVTNVQNFDFEKDQTPMLPPMQLTDRVRRVLGWIDPPDQETG
ncbi:HNH endonuclease signature motif containing protein [Glutamicibacter sp. M10]|uniref:HNH endonuclease signature motif containing protein n=1 Tax=Glutamicibacter sp. M10 TaxID=3023076 RepID=UPI0021C744CA|nr:HNH endonuclease signature motif containing protein [Glutamicibacter sp. M10]UXN32107.1 HNH endonuclease [Glutamicibacter sp. M10]